MPYVTETIYDRVDSERTLVDITNLKDNYITKNEVKIAKNYRIKIEL